LAKAGVAGGTPSVARNIAFNVAARGVLIVLSIAITPVLVRRLGTDQYGIYALATGLGAGLTNVLALGLIPGVIALLSRSIARGNPAETEKIVGTGFTLFAVIGVVSAGVLALLVPVVVTRVLRVPPALQGVAATALWLSALGLGFNLVFAVFNAVPYALQRYDIIAGRLVGLTILSMAATVVFVLLYANLTGVIAIQVAGGIAGLILYFVISRRELKGVRLLPGFDRPTFVRLARFTAFKSVGDLALVFASRFDQFAVGSLLNVGAVGLYAIPANTCQRILQLLYEVTAPLFPSMSTIEDDEARRLLLLRGTRLVALVAAMLTVTLIVLAEPILRFWIGGSQGVEVGRDAALAFRLLALAIFAQAVASVSGFYCEAIQRPFVNSSFVVLGAIVQVPALLLLIPRYGINGAAAGVLLASLVQTVPFLALMTVRVARVGVSRLFRDALLWPCVSAAAAGAVGIFAERYAVTLLGLLAVAAMMAAVYLVVAAFTGAVRAADVLQIEKILPIRLESVPGNRLLLRLLRP
jgi:O-antigen/teichoic acid export membrane protein